MRILDCDSRPSIACAARSSRPSGPCPPPLLGIWTLGTCFWAPTIHSFLSKIILGPTLKVSGGLDREPRSTAHTARVKLVGLHGGHDLSEELTRSRFEELNAKLFQKVGIIMHRA